MRRVTESLCCTPEAHVTQYVNYTGIPDYFLMSTFSEEFSLTVRSILSGKILKLPDEM